MSRGRAQVYREGSRGVTEGVRRDVTFNSIILVPIPTILNNLGSRGVNKPGERRRKEGERMEGESEDVAGGAGGGGEPRGGGRSEVQ